MFVKHFDLAVDELHPDVKRRLETRVLVRDKKGGVFGGTYRWRPDNSDADLVTTSTTEDVPVRTAETSAAAGVPRPVDVGGPAKGCALVPADGGFDLTSSGHDVSDAADEFSFAPAPRTGDFDVSTRLAALDAPNRYAKAGLMARAGTAAGDPFVFVLARPGNQDVGWVGGHGFAFQYRGGAGAAVQKQNVGPAPAYPNAWLRLRRAGNEFSAFVSADGVGWTLLAKATTALPREVLVGPAVTAHGRDRGETATARFRDAASVRARTWFYPGPGDCLSCHNAASGGVLGVNARQLNGDFAYPTGRTDNQLRAWAHAGLIDPAREADVPHAPRLVPLTDSAAPLQDRVRSFLDSNCAQCHRPGVTGGYFDARYDTPFDKQNLLLGGVRNALNIDGGKLVVPGDVAKSVLFHRLASPTQAERMPPLGKNTRDETAERVVSEWIRSLPAGK